MTRIGFNRASLTACALILAACGTTSSGTPGTPKDPDVPLEPGETVDLELPQELRARQQELQGEMDDVSNWDAEKFLDETRIEFEALDYDPTEAVGLDLIEDSYLGVSDRERQVLADHGFFISSENVFPTFTYGYETIYANDLPLYVSADSILWALHTSYDNILKGFEVQSLLPALEGIIDGMREALEKSELSGTTRDDLDLYLSVAAALLEGSAGRSAEPANESIVAQLVEKCVKAEGSESIELLGSRRKIDFSQCEPRGHYTDSEALERYFRAMMWLGRIDFRLIETQSDGSQVFQRRQFEAGWHLVGLMGEREHELHQGVDALITAFVGEHDYMTVSQFDALEDDLDLNGAEGGLDAMSDEKIAQAIIDGGYGTQRISSHYMVNGVGAKTLPLSSSFAFFGQRYVIDSHVFSNVVYDRAGGGTVSRMMPSPLDAAYAALGNDQAGMLLEDELEAHAYAPDLEKMRVLVDSEPAEFWDQNLYNRWLGALRTLSPDQARDVGEGETLPGVAQTQSWGARLLNTQLASWAELRHDTILYVKQSYTSGAVCEFPDAYVEPYPRFFEALEGYASHAASVIETLPFEPPAGVPEYFETFTASVGTLREMAEHQRTGAAHSDEHLEFINRTVRLTSAGCVPDDAEGWYPDMIYGDPIEYSPTVADVHTQPTDAAGNEVGRVLHVATGRPRLMVVTVETCSGPRAYAGLASSYYEFVEEDWNRMTDPEWQERLHETPPSDPEFIAPLIARE